MAALLDCESLTYLKTLCKEDKGSGPQVKTLAQGWGPEFISTEFIEKLISTVGVSVIPACLIKRQGVERGESPEAQGQRDAVPNKIERE